MTMKMTVIGGALLLIMPMWAMAASVDLQVSRSQSLCMQIRELLQKNVIGEARLNPNAEPFSQIRWEPAVLGGTAPKTRHCSSLDVAVMDLDNNGRKELVVKATFCMKGAPSDSLYLFPEDSRVLEEASWQNLAPLLATTDKFERTGGRYPLTGIPLEQASVRSMPELKTVFSVHPFQVGNMAYVALTDGYEEQIVIAKYLGGDRIEDQCYLRISKES